MINQGTVAAIASSLMAQGVNLSDQSDIWWYGAFRREHVKRFVALAWEIAEETIAQDPQKTQSTKDKT